MNKNMKGLAVWIWVIGGVVIGIIAFSVFIKLTSLVAQAQQQEEAKKTYENIVNSVKNYCDVREGMATTPRIIFPNIVSSMYASNDQKNPNIEGNVTIGNYVCMNISNVITCDWASCEVEMAMLEKKDQLLSLMDNIVGRVGNTEYLLDLRRTDCGVALLEYGMKTICSTCDLDKANILITCNDSTGSAPVLLTYKNITVLSDITPWIDGKVEMKTLTENVANYFKGEKILVLWEDKNSDPEDASRIDIISNLKSLGFDVAVKRHTETVDFKIYDQVWLLRPGWCDPPRKGAEEVGCVGLATWSDSEVADLKGINTFLVTDVNALGGNIENNVVNRILKENRISILQFPECKCDCGKGYVDTQITDNDLTKGLSVFKVNAVASLGCV